MRHRTLLAHDISGKSRARHRPASQARRRCNNNREETMRDTNRSLSRADQLNLLHQTSADTLMGKLLRSFWHPIAISDHVANGKAIPVRILGEDLTLYRGATGKPALVDGRCA